MLNYILSKTNSPNFPATIIAYKDDEKNFVIGKPAMLTNRLPELVFNR